MYFAQRLYIFYRVHDMILAFVTLKPLYVLKRPDKCVYTVKKKNTIANSKQHRTVRFIHPEKCADL